MTTPRIAFVFRCGRTSLLERVHQGQSPDEMLYGVKYLREGGDDCPLVEEAKSSWAWRHRLFYPAEWLIARWTGVGFALQLVLEKLSLLRNVDAIVTTRDTCGLPIALLKYLGLLETPVLYISQGLGDRIEQLPELALRRRAVKWLYGRFLHAVERIAVLGKGACEPLEHTFDLATGSVICLLFGVDIHFWVPDGTSKCGEEILSVGSDPSRDYETLLNAVGDMPLRIVTRLGLPSNPVRRNVLVGGEYTDLDLKRLYQQSRFVVTPLKDVAQPSGQSATLQAMACGKAVILTRTRGLWDPEGMRHEENCLLVPPEDAAALQGAIRYLADNPDIAQRLGKSARRTVEDRYDSKRFARELKGEVLSAIGRAIA